MAELADAHGSGPCECKFMQVQVLLPAPFRVVITDLTVMTTLFLLICRRDILYRDPFAKISGVSLCGFFLGNLKITDKAVEDDDPLCPVFSGSLHFIDVDMIDQLSQKRSGQYLHLQKSVYRLRNASLPSRSFPISPSFCCKDAIFLSSSRSVSYL